jgi:hypothetical protein
MANTFLTPTAIARKLSMHLATSLGFAASIDRRHDDRFGKSGAQIGDEFSIKIPPRLQVTRAVAMPATPQSVVETKRTLKVSYAHVAVQMTDAQLQMHIDDFTAQVVEPAAIALAADIDLQGTQLYNEVFNIVNTIGGGAPTTLATYLLADAKLTEEGVPKNQNSRRMVCINAEMNRQIINALKGLYHDNASISKQFLDAVMMRAAGFDWLYDQNMHLHTNGTRVSAAASNLINGVPDSGDTTIAIDAAGNALTFKKGDVFTIAGVNAIDPQSRQSTGRLRQFVVTADTVSTAGGAVAALPIYPAITSTGQNQTVDTLPADNALLTFNGAAASSKGHQGLAYHKDAFALAMVDDMLPNGVDFAARTSPSDAQAWRVSLSIIRDYGISAHNYPCRVGAYYGWMCQRPELAVRVTT